MKPAVLLNTLIELTFGIYFDNKSSTHYKLNSKCTVFVVIKKASITIPRDDLTLAMLM